jgi:xanthine/uracil permease
LALFSPWATSSYRVGKTDTKIALSVSILDDSLIVEGCRRGSALGQDKQLDNWIRFGKIAYLGQTGLWLLFFFKVFRSRKLNISEVVVWFVGLIVFLLAFLMLLHPIIECLWKEIPPPLIFMGEWQINGIGVFLLIVAVLLEVSANVLYGKDSS